MPQNQPGKIITFYSYKGGTGRSMALANVAWILAANRKKVLLIDWDLEAPGLHRFFKPFLIDKDITSTEGLIDFVINYADAAIKPPAPGDESKDWLTPYAELGQYALSVNYKDFPKPGRIDLVPAGRQNATYATRVNSFNWQNLYDRLGGGQFFEAVKARMISEYDYILIDSRTGVSDTAGISTIQMPDILAVFFTYNNQSIEGAGAVAKSVFEIRQKAAKGANGSGIQIFPVPTRVEQTESDKLSLRQRYAQKVFDGVLPGGINRTTYWSEVEVPYVPYYSYEEILAAIIDDPNDAKRMLRPLVRLSNYITGSDITEYHFSISPEEKSSILTEYAAIPDFAGERIVPQSKVVESADDEVLRRAESFYLKLTPQEQVESKRVFSRLVLLQGEQYSIIRVNLKDFNDSAHSLLRSLIAGGLVIQAKSATTGDETVEIANHLLVDKWGRFRDWCKDDMGFLLWRQNFQVGLQDWEASTDKDMWLLRGTALKEAEKWQRERYADFNNKEKEFIQASLFKSQKEYSTTALSGSVFILRPYGKKNEIDFDRVEKELIQPALQTLNLQEVSGGIIFEPGGIQDDLLSRLLLADLVIADISISNANVFYELGIRQALRDKKTVLIKATGSEPSPFDVISYRYVQYDINAPGASMSIMVRAVQDTIQAGRIDSPVFNMLPNLHVQNIERLISVPQDFTEEVQMAANSNEPGKLSLLAAEAESFPWQISGLRLAGSWLVLLRSLNAAMQVWEKIRQYIPADAEANQQLATIYQRLAEKEAPVNAQKEAELLAKSDLSIENLLKDTTEISKTQRAEAYALKARNAKANWLKSWSTVDPTARGIAALESVYLEAAYQLYENSYFESLDNFYAGINALSLLSILIELCQKYPSEWSVNFKRQAEADLRLEEWKEKKVNLAASVQISIDAEKRRQAGNDKGDIWLSITEADYTFLAEENPRRIASVYSSALRQAQPFHFESVERQIRIFEQLRLFPEKVQAVLNVIPPYSSDVQQATHYLLFSGHMIDHPGRQTPRFPLVKESAVRQKIKEVIETEIMKENRVLKGIAGGTSGGDILFHEVCKELSIPSMMYLALPRDQYMQQAVAYAGLSWADRFNILYAALPHPVLSQGVELPKWLQNKLNYSIWERNNLWELHSALLNGSLHMTLLALWNGSNADGPGGTDALIKTAESRGAKVRVIDINAIK